MLVCGITNASNALFWATFWVNCSLGVSGSHIQDVDAVTCFIVSCIHSDNLIGDCCGRFCLVVYSIFLVPYACPVSDSVHSNHQNQTNYAWVNLCLVIGGLCRHRALNDVVTRAWFLLALSLLKSHEMRRSGGPRPTSSQNERTKSDVSPPPNEIFGYCKLEYDNLVENLEITCWFYVKNCIFVHMTKKKFSVTGPPSETLARFPPLAMLQSGGARTALWSEICQLHVY